MSEFSILFSKMHKIILGVVISLFFSQLLYTHEKQRSSKFIIEIKLDKEEYLQGEDVYITFVIKNNGSKRDSVNNYEIQYLCNLLEIRDENNKLPEKTEYKDLGKDVIYTTLDHGETLTLSANINEYRGFKGSQNFRYFPAGTYTIVSIFADLNNEPIPANTVTFKVTTPEGDELKALNDFQYFDDFYNKNPKPTEAELKKLIDKSIEFIYKYPKSIYTTRVLFFFRYERERLKYKYDQSMLEDIKYFTDNNLKDKNILSLLRTANRLELKLYGKDDAKIYLNNIKFKIDDTKTVDGINDLIKSDE
jgi:hypothetical protein